MLETLVSSRIRRVLFEHLLIHPNDHFYLRGLAKELDLSVSPLRRELKRLERLGLLRTIQEGNMLFYTVNPTSPAFLQLRQAGRPTEAPSTVAAIGQAGLRAPRPAGDDRRGGQGSGLGIVAHSPEPRAQSVQAVPIGVISRTSPSFWRSPLSHPAFIGAAAIGVALILIMASLFYLTLTNQRLVSQASQALTTRKAEVTVVAPQPSASGAMSGRRWRVLPGGFGGFSSGADSESY